MNSIIISDTAILGLDYQSTKENAIYLNLLRDKGYKIIFLSNRPELCMRKIGAYVSPTGEIFYRYLGCCDTKGNGIDLIFHDDRHIIEEINIKYDYTIFGNGICTFDSEDNLKHQGNFISRELLNEMVNVFRKNGYKSFGELQQLQRDTHGDRCFSGREDVYKFFTPEIGTTEISDNVYGMQCSFRSNTEDKEIIKSIETAVTPIIGYILNGKPCFYHKDVNKLVALYNLANNGNINIDKSIILLSEITDNVINSIYKADNLIDTNANSCEYGPINHILRKII